MDFDLMYRTSSLSQFQQLFASGFDVNQKDNRGETLLHVATWYHAIGLVQELMARNVDVNIQRGNGDTPLHMASRYDCQDIIRVLIALSDLSIRNNDGRTASEVAFSEDIRTYISNYESAFYLKEPDCLK
jgi:ankyrin repeat protein